jgi:hypothetical protein
MARVSRTKIPREYANDMRRAARGFKGAATFSRRVGYDAAAMRKLRDVAAENNAENFRSDGSAMGASWRGKAAGAVVLDNAVDTGILRRHATTPWLLKPRVQAKSIRFNVPKSRVPYIRFVGAAIMGWTPRGSRKVADTILVEIGRIAERKRRP